ncbi:hypothetical protein [Xanthovirga aplysinae]|uniref:hypothetical protein n=1 Tax=Xanthovirga aplysinae TaxID=2529853 RepID=UPI0012BBD68D|nr:hypothetical protein [Xanthovirga aplysinae]MTI30851.1 hypothetical protein [Xanthovirga aplysinae]
MGQKAFTERIDSKKLGKSSYGLFDLAKKEKNFLMIVAALTFVAGMITPYTQAAAWFGFMLAGYSAIANDSIQSIGTFIASNSKTKWYILWLFIGLIFIAAIANSWIVNDGDVSSGRLTAKGFETAPTSFQFLQLAAPLILLILTRFKMPVSTSFLLLNVFATKSSGITSVLNKSLVGYLLAFVVAIIVWFIVGKVLNKFVKGKAASWWKPVQWITSGFLWFQWVQQDSSNIAIFLPRQLDVIELTCFVGFIFLGLGLLFYLKGDRIQEIVTEKAGITDVRAATLVDFTYACLLYYFKTLNKIPMSTTWVFLGLLAGREVAISLSKKRAKKRSKSLVKSFKMMSKDFAIASVGLIISLILALAINEDVRAEIFASLF